MAKRFVSCSRKDSIAARKLIEAFKSMGQEVWVNWLQQIFRGIEEADAFSQSQWTALFGSETTCKELCPGFSVPH